MREISRREMCIGLSAIAAIPTTAEPQTTAAPPPASATLSQAKVFPIDQMPVRKMANGGESRDVLRGTLATGEVVAVHESEQPAGTPPNPLHAIQHSEVIVIIQGTVLFEHDGKSDKLGSGAVILVTPGTQHAIRNIGEDTAKYCVVQIGGDTKKS
jgi:mannose-6-phosphate isomerase-like protein (cupin superfamily)